MTTASSSVSMCPNLSKDSELAPIALFVYNRAEHTQRTVDSLRENDLASRSNLFVFSDGPKDEAGSAAVRQIRTYIPTIQGFRSVTVIERDWNWGLANSVIGGITELINEFGRVITVEDDLLTTPDFLTFINQALERYETESRIFSVSGFNFGFTGPEHYPYDAFCFYRSSSLGWGTWKDRWARADWKIADYHHFCTDRKQRRQFNRGGDDLSNMLALHMHGKIDSWAIRWAYTHFKQDAFALLSFLPRVFHIGSGDSATYSRRKCFKQLPLTGERKSKFHYPDSARIEEPFAMELQKSLRSSLAKKLVRHFLVGRSSLTANQIDSSKFAVPEEAKHSAVPGANRRSFLD